MNDCFLEMLVVGTPTSYPSPQGGGETSTLAFNSETSDDTRIGSKIPLPLVGRGKGWGGATSVRCAADGGGVG